MEQGKNSSQNENSERFSFIAIVCIVGIIIYEILKTKL